MTLEQAANLYGLAVACALILVLWWGTR